MSEDILALIILCCFIVAAIVAYCLIKKAEKNKNMKKTKAKFDDKPRLKLNLPFLSKSETKFLAVFQNSLPSEYVAFPKLAMNRIVRPDGSLIVYHEIENSIVDIVVFLKSNMQPVLVVDLIDPMKGDKLLTKMDEFVEKSLKSVNLPVLRLNLDHEYERVELLNAFLDKMDPLTIAQLKKSK
ncbi:MAG: DUF2726 domain-containing protein [Christensenellales bacterium]